MVTLNDMLELKYNTTFLHLIARDPNDHHLLHEFVISRSARDRVSRISGLQRSWSQNRLTAADRVINDHNKATKHGPEMGWGVDTSQIAPELLKAELTSLHMYERPMDGVEITADILLHPMQVETVKAFYGENDETLHGSDQR